MKISIAQFAVTPGDTTANLAQISDLSAEAAARGADLLCLPEMCTTGFDWGSNREHLRDASASIDELKDIAPTSKWKAFSPLRSETTSTSKLWIFADNPRPPLTPAGSIFLFGRPALRWLLASDLKMG